MPGFDQTGPQGQGPMTGKGMGPCGGGVRRGCGYRRCGGRFAGRAYLTKNEEIQDLEEEAKNLEADLKAVKERISEIKK
jgi:hypothetical protein